MKLALFTHMPWPTGIDQKSVFDNTISQVKLAESIGYHSAWFAEHHFTRYSISASLMIILGYISAITETIRLGTGVIVPSLHNPIRVAEDAAHVDLLSNGRLDIGFGRGSFGYEFEGFNVPNNDHDTFQSSVLDIRNLLSTNNQYFTSSYSTKLELPLVPNPVQKPHPPFYIAASNSVETLDFLVRNEFKICIAVVQDTNKALELIDRYYAACMNMNRSPYMEDVPFFRYIHVAETEKKAEENTKKHVNWIQDIMQWRRNNSNRSELGFLNDEWRESVKEYSIDFSYIKNNRAFIGTPEQVAEKVNFLKDHNISYLGCNFALGGLNQSKIIESMKLFDKKVVPLIS
jgi:alkanesulfonate monooxygenase SsuD/methylene tetrahydromethanopterin reductase-like flavin-dependent oxidoreductase (luciferase family)